MSALPASDAVLAGPVSLGATATLVGWFFPVDHAQVAFGARRGAAEQAAARIACDDLVAATSVRFREDLGGWGVVVWADRPA